MSPTDSLVKRNACIACACHLRSRDARESLTTIFWPESDAENARHAAAADCTTLRNAVGREYTRFLALWRNVDPEFQQMADSARQRLGTLRGAAH